ncbi:MAG TPA: aminotransferase class IV [Chitinophagaceae bacterium]|nr:aminotransferase class IV [Chitinophagaceae bacterium]
MAFLIYFGSMGQICFNGKFLPISGPVLRVDNRGFRYGDGLFETIKIWQGKMLLEQLHFERLFSSLSILKYEVPIFFIQKKIKEEILKLCQVNKVDKQARVRISVFRGNGGLYDEDSSLQYIIECWPLNESVNRLNENGLVIDIFPVARKSADLFSNLKSANFLPYSMAALYAMENKLNDCLVLNTDGYVADSTIANVFLINDEIIKTPDLSQGCVSGVMRKHLIATLKEGGFEVRETQISDTDLEMADELFLTNAINGIRWVRQFREKTYSHQKTMEIYNRFVKTVFC